MRGLLYLHVHTPPKTEAGEKWFERDEGDARLARDRRLIKTKYPDLKYGLNHRNKAVFLYGEIFLKEESSGIPTKIGIKILFPDDYPKTEPIAVETSNLFEHIPDRHFYPNGICCLWLPPESQWKERDENGLLNFLDHAAVFFERQLIYDSTGGKMWAWGERITARSEDVVVLKVTEPDFRRLAEEFPRTWKTVAQVVAERLRQRSVFLNAPNSHPRLFLGCSAESLVVAQEIQLGLKHDKINAVVWNNGVFGPSSVTIDALLTEVNESDFAVFVFSPDDKVVSRKHQYSAPRDNTIFELGLFMGRLERNRTFIVKEHSSDVKIPTDLLGITPLTYVYRRGEDLTAAVATVCTDLRKTVQKLGAR